MLRKTLCTVVVVSVLLVGAPRSEGAPSSLERKAAVFLLDKINAKRQSQALVQPLKEWATGMTFRAMTVEAEDHSSYMATNNVLDHFGYDDRVARLQDEGQGIGYICENVARVSGVAEYKVAMRMIFKVWKNSTAGHRECMYDEESPIRHFKTWAGIGVERRGKSKWWATFLAGVDSSPDSP